MREIHNVKKIIKKKKDIAKPASQPNKQASKSDPLFLHSIHTVSKTN
jgi:hypothetical protein